MWVPVCVHVCEGVSVYVLQSVNQAVLLLIGAAAIQRGPRPCFQTSPCNKQDTLEKKCPCKQPWLMTASAFSLLSPQGPQKD